MSAPIRVGLAGAGTWATRCYAPLFASGSDTELSCVWSRTEANASALAERYGVQSTTDVDELLDHSDLVITCVPPTVQEELAVRVGQRSIPILLDKPLAGSIRGAIAIADALVAGGSPSLFALTLRFAPETRQFLEELSREEPVFAHAWMITGSSLTNSGGWREEDGDRSRGAIRSEAPHVLDLLDAAMGSIASVTGSSDRGGWAALSCVHASGALSSLVVSNTSNVAASAIGMEVYCRSGRRVQLDLTRRIGADTFSALRAAAVEVARGERHPLDVHHAVQLQQTVELATTAIKAER